MKKLINYLSPYKKECIIAPSFKMLEALFELFVPLVISDIIDKGILGHDSSVIVKSGILLVLLALIGLSCALMAQFFAARAAIGFASTVRNVLYEKILGLSYENVDRQGTSSLITRITNDINQVQNGINLALRLLLRSPFIVFGAMIMAFTINVRAAFIFVIVIPVLFAVVFAITLTTIPLYKKIQKSLDKLTGLIRENLSGVRVIRAFSRNSSEEKEFEEENEGMYRLQLVTSRLSALLNPLTLVIVNVAMIILISTGSRLVFDGYLTSGQVYALVNYMSQILVELVKLANLFISINKALASAGRISDTLSITETMSDNGTIDAAKLSANASPLISFKNVSFTYPGANEESLTDLSFDIESGKTVGIIGGTGSGKTSLVNLLMRFYDAGKGEILYKGKSIKELTLNSYRNQFAPVMQKAQLFSGTLRENLLVANPGATDECMNEAVRLSVSEDIISKKGKGLDFEITEGGANLSGGQKQRLSIARALCKESPVLILDDSSSALDYKTDETLRANLKTLNKTVIIISQRIVSIKDADQIIVLDDGRIDSIGTHAELLEKSAEYREICASQEGSETV